MIQLQDGVFLYYWWQWTVC